MVRQALPVVTTGIRPVRRESQSGFSVIELVVVIAIISIMIAMSLWTLTPRRRFVAADDTAIQIAEFVREASQSAVADRQTARIEIDTTARTIKVYDEDGPNPDRLLRQELLAGPELVQIKTPSTNAPGTLPTEMKYTAAAFSSGVWQARFNGSGSMIDMTGAPAPMSVSFLVWSPAAGNATASGPGSSQDCRAVTIFGPTSSTRIVRWNGSAWVRR